MCHFNNMNLYNSGNNIQNLSQMQSYAVKKQIDVQTEAAKNSIHTANKMAIDDHQHQLALQRDIKRAELLEINYKKRQLITRSVAENSDGYLMMELIDPEGKRSYSGSICSERYLRAEYFFAADSVLNEEVLHIFWQGEENGFFLSGKTMNAKAMSKEFLAKGVAFRIPRRIKKEMMEQIFAFLINRAEKIEIPRCIGWTKNSAGVWVFKKEEANTLEGMNDEKW